MDIREPRISSKARIDGNDLLIKRFELRQDVRCKRRAAKSKGSQEEVVCSEILGWTPARCDFAVVDNPFSDPRQYSARSPPGRQKHPPVPNRSALSRGGFRWRRPRVER